MARFKFLILIGFVVGIFVFLGFRFIAPRIFQNSNETVGVVGRYNTYGLPTPILSTIGMGLTVLDKSGQPTPGIAKTWEGSDSGKTWIFHLRQDLHWQDGTNVVSDDINYNFQDADVQRPDKYTIIFKLGSSFAPFPVTVARPVFKKGLLGTGQWKVVNLSLAGEYVETLTLQDSSNDQRVYKFYPTEERAKLAYELGEVRKIQDLIDDKPFETWTNTKVTKNVNKQRYVAVFFNTKDDFLKDKDVRQALTYAIDKDSLSADREYGPISSNSWAYNPSLKHYDLDPAKAKGLIDKSQLSPEQKANLKIKLTTTPELLSTADKIIKDWKNIGIDATLQVTSFLPDQYQAFLGIYDIPLDPDQYMTWHSSQTQTNITRYDNPRISKLLEDGRLETNPEKRKGVYLDFQRFLVEDTPAAFLFYPTYFTIERK
ncbi:MAG TPA: ABC transporter substrate-binding protein [Candidatus Saccharimonadales bacterium]|nr:ABC transporter substrate-binding protein [Candidatus Saccharimonadales bacterium]